MGCHGNHEISKTQITFIFEDNIFLHLSGPIGQIEEFPIIGFYLYHVTSAGQSSNWTTSGIKQHILTVDLTL